MSLNAWQWVVNKQLPSEHAAVQGMQAEVLRKLQELGWEERELFGVRLALEEALVNAIKHGNLNDQAKRVHFACKVAQDRIWVQITDEGHGFDPGQVVDCRHEENRERPCGRGLLLMRSFMNRVEFHDRGRSVVMEKSRPGAAEGLPAPERTGSLPPLDQGPKKAPGNPQ